MQARTVAGRRCLSERHIPLLASFSGRWVLYRRQGGRWLGHQHRRLRRGTKPSDRTQDSAAITKDDAEIFQISIGQVRQDGEVDPVLGKALRVLGQPGDASAIPRPKNANPRPRASAGGEVRKGSSFNVGPG